MLQSIMTSQRATTLRLPEGLLRDVTLIARTQNKSLNTLVVEALQRIQEDEQKKRLFDDYTLAGEDADVEFAFVPQMEAVNHGES